MFKTVTMAKLYLTQEHYSKALDIIEEVLKEKERPEILYYKAEALEGLNRNEEAEKILFDLMDEGYVEEHVSRLLERIYTKTGKKMTQEEHIPPEEIASAYEKIGDLHRALDYYEQKVNELRNKTEG